MEQVLTALRAAGEPTRLRLLALLARSELTVSEITQILGQSQPRVSRHLKLLADAGLVDRCREGNWAFYRLAQGQSGPQGLRGMATLAAQLVGFLPDQDPVLLGDLDRLEAVRRGRAEAAAAYFRANADQWGRIQALHLPEEAIEKALIQLIGQDPVNRHVDFGTGTGRMLELLAAQTDDALGIDLSHDMLALARANLDRAGLTRAQVRHGDIFALSLLPNSVDLVTIHQVLHFLADPGRAVEEAARILVPGGRLAIIDFAPHRLEFLREEHSHRRLGFADDEVIGWFEACGLTLDTMRTLPDHATSEGAGQGGAENPTLTVCIWLARKATALHIVQEKEAS